MLPQVKNENRLEQIDEESQQLTTRLSPDQMMDELSIKVESLKVQHPDRLNTESSVRSDAEEDYKYGQMKSDDENDSPCQINLNLFD